jgi:hypothetical protein
VSGPNEALPMMLRAFMADASGPALA